jgi:hypothetical protein
MKPGLKISDDCQSIAVVAAGVHASSVRMVEQARRGCPGASRTIEGANCKRSDVAADKAFRIVQAAPCQNDRKQQRPSGANRQQAEPVAERVGAERRRSPLTSLEALDRPSQTLHLSHGRI